MAESKFNEVKFTDADVVNLDDYIPAGEYNPHNVRPFLLHDAGFVLAVVFASSLQDALDEAVDADKLDQFLVKPEDYDDYGGEDAVYEKCALLGNAGEPFDIENVDYIELPNPPRSFCLLFNGMEM